MVLQISKQSPLPQVGSEVEADVDQSGNSAAVTTTARKKEVHRRTREQIMIDANIPTVEEVRTMSLPDLIARRPVSKTRANCSVRAYAERFASHPRIQELDPRTSSLHPGELARRWTALRLEAGNGHADLSMTKAVQYHLQHVIQADETMQSLINGHWAAYTREYTTRKYLDKRKERFAANPEWKASQYASTKKSLELRMEREINEEDVTFSQLIERDQLQFQGLNAMQVEEMTRYLYEEQRPRTRAMRQVKEFFLFNHYPHHEIVAAISARRKWIDTCWQKRQRDRKLKQKGNTSAIATIEDQEATHDEIKEPENDHDEPLCHLLHQVDWWQPRM